MSTHVQTQSKWREISGLTVEAEKTLEGAERRAALRKIRDAADVEIRAELKAAAEDADFKGERTFLWEPAEAVCRRLEITQNALNRHLKELTGLSIQQLADKIRAEGLRERIRADMVQFVQGLARQPGSGEVFGVKSMAYFRDELKARQFRNSSNNATRAIEMGFANYTRYYRACLLQYGQTPTQIEIETLREIAQFFDLANDLLNRKAATVYGNDRDPRYDNYRKPYSDDWAEALKNRPEWIAEKKALFGLSKSVEEWV